MPAIGNIKGQLSLTVAGSEPINLGTIEIELRATSSVDSNGNLLLGIKPNMREVREAIEEIFGQAEARP